MYLSKDGVDNDGCGYSVNTSCKSISQVRNSFLKFNVSQDYDSGLTYPPLSVYIKNGEYKLSIIEIQLYRFNISFQPFDEINPNVIITATNKFGMFDVIYDNSSSKIAPTSITFKSLVFGGVSAGNRSLIEVNTDIPGNPVNIARTMISIQGSKFSNNQVRNSLISLVNTSLVIADKQDLGTVSISGSTCNGNSVSNGIISVLGVSTGLIYNTIFKNNDAQHYGGGITVTISSVSPSNPSFVLVSNCVFNKNMATGGSDIWIYGKASNHLELSILNSSFSESSGGGFNSKGGSILSENITRLNIQDSQFENDYSVYGGSLYITGTNYSNLSNVTIRNNHIDKNNADSIGGAIYLTGGSNLVINQSDISGNSASSSSAIYCIQGSSLSLLNTILSKNTSPNDTTSDGIGCGIPISCNLQTTGLSSSYKCSQSTTSSSTTKTTGTSSTTSDTTLTNVTEVDFDTIELIGTDFGDSFTFTKVFVGENDITSHCEMVTPQTDIKCNYTEYSKQHQTITVQTTGSKVSEELVFAPRIRLDDFGRNIFPIGDQVIDLYGTFFEADINSSLSVELKLGEKKGTCKTDLVYSMFVRCTLPSEFASDKTEFRIIMNGIESNPRSFPLQPTNLTTILLNTTSSESGPQYEIKGNFLTSKAYISLNHHLPLNCTTSKTDVYDPNLYCDIPADCEHCQSECQNIVYNDTINYLSKTLFHDFDLDAVQAFCSNDTKVTNFIFNVSLHCDNILPDHNVNWKDEFVLTLTKESTNADGTIASEVTGCSTFRYLGKSSFQCEIGQLFTTEKLQFQLTYKSGPDTFTSKLPRIFNSDYSSDSGLTFKCNYNTINFTEIEVTPSPTPEPSTSSENGSNEETPTPSTKTPSPSNTPTPTPTNNIEGSHDPENPTSSTTAGTNVNDDHKQSSSERSTKYSNLFIFISIFTIGLLL
eukprot:gene5869-7301_t